MQIWLINHLVVFLVDRTHASKPSLFRFHINWHKAESHEDEQPRLVDSPGTFPCSVLENRPTSIAEEIPI